MTNKLFSTLIDENITNIKDIMTWQNYELNDTVLPVLPLVKDHALMVLKKSYGRTLVSDEILDELLIDVFVYFPVLLQQLSITRLIDAYGVGKSDIDTVETKRNETLLMEVDQNSLNTQNLMRTDTENMEKEATTTGTVSIADTSITTQSSLTNITNTSEMEETGGKTVNVAHNMPEQSIIGQTGNFIADDQGTPVLTTSYIQEANETFMTTNPLQSMETSTQNINNSNEIENDSVTTNNITVADTGTSTNTTSNTGTESNEASSSQSGTNEITETVTSTLTNKQYAYEIKAFLETADSIIAFKKWESNFSWIEGII